MEEVTFHLRTVTPMFMAGADQSTAELRAPSFRGEMRYWQRALVGGIVGTNAGGLKQVVEQETKIFGATDTSSAVSMRISAPSHEPVKFIEPISRRVGTTRQATGKGYLLWSMAESGRVERGNYKPARWYFPPGTRFRVTLSAQDQHEMRLKQAVACFWLLTHLGAVGSRSRRCAGSLEVEEVHATLEDLLQIPLASFRGATSIEELQNQIEDGIKTARSLYIPELSPIQVSQARFDVVAPQICRIWILHNNGSAWNGLDKAMTAIGENLQAYRSGITPLWRRKIFGLPLKNVSGSRVASPLLLRVAKLQGGQYVGMAVLFKTTGGGAGQGGYKLIEDWIDAFPGRQEVNL
jgi:CRISPR-associated protein Cmr1